MFKLPCHYCFRYSKNNLICSGCKWAFYCNIECQKNDWKYGSKIGRDNGISDGKRHKDECKIPCIENQLGFDNCLDYSTICNDIESISVELKEMIGNFYENSQIIIQGTFQEGWLGMEKEDIHKKNPLKSILKYPPYSLIKFNTSEKEAIADFEMFSFKLNLSSIGDLSSVELNTMLSNTKNFELMNSYPPKKLKFHPGHVYSSIGLCDPLQLMISKLVETNGEIVKYQTYNFNEFNLARNIILREMFLDHDIDEYSILQVWFSNNLTKTAYQHLLKTLKKLLDNLSDVVKSNDLKVEKYFQSWIKDNSSEFNEEHYFFYPYEDLFPLNCFKNNKDIEDYAKYIYNGSIFLNNQQISFENPIFKTAKQNNLAKFHQNIFFSLDMEIFKTSQSDSVFQIIENHYLNQLKELRKNLWNNKISFEIFTEFKLSFDVKSIKYLRSKNSNLIDWNDSLNLNNLSSICSLLRGCGFKKTLQIVGLSLYDFRIIGADLKDFQLLDSIKTCKNSIQLLMDFDNKIHSHHDFLNALRYLQYKDREKMFESKQYLNNFFIKHPFTSHFNSLADGYLSKYFQQYFYIELKKQLTENKLNLLKLNKDLDWNSMHLNNGTNLRFIVGSKKLDKSQTNNLIDKYCIN